MIRAVLLAALAAAAPAGAETPMSGEDFRAATEGHTLYFQNEAGEYFGAEQYLEDDRTIWLPRGGRCVDGRWRASEGRICFLYYDAVACWRVYGANGEVASAEAADPGDAPLTLYAFRKEAAPLLCPDGPGV